jgi:hypothetical protein
MNHRIFFGIAALLCACSSSPAGGSGSDASSGVALSDFCTATAEARCRAEVTCGAVPESRLAACIRIEASGCDLDRLVARVGSGRVAYDGAAYRRCLDRFAATQFCEDGRSPVFPNDDPDCIQAAVGRVAPGESCGQGLGPLAFLECEEGTCMFQGCSGECRPLPELGESCSPSPCGTGLHCLDGTCEPLAGAGESCAPFARDCAAGLFCHAAGYDARGTCAAPLAVGAACNYGLDVCVPGAYCPQRAQATCVAYAGEGAPCDEVPDDCRAGLHCASGTCIAQEPPGGDCRWDDDCLYPATCDEETHACVQGPVVGEPCSPGSVRCAIGWCDGTTCRPMVPPGEACAHDFECGGPETSCEDGRCIPWGAPGCGG